MEAACFATSSEALVQFLSWKLRLVHAKYAGSFTAELYECQP